MRGENSGRHTTHAWGLGSSPHARGKPLLMAALSASMGLIPACAGKTVEPLVGAGDVEAHPRMRGENWAVHSCAVHNLGSSPHARGKPPPPRSPKLPARLIPACAGKTEAISCHRRSAKAHPRMRGENTSRVKIVSRLRGSSPHARGKLYRPRCNTTVRGLIPACAGKTKRWLEELGVARAHPRMRGENRCCELLKCCVEGSSPHARGKHDTDFHTLRAWGLIPACAGKTPAK